MTDYFSLVSGLVGAAFTSAAGFDLVDGCRLSTTFFYSTAFFSTDFAITLSVASVLGFSCYCLEEVRTDGIGASVLVDGFAATYLTFSGSGAFGLTSLVASCFCATLDEVRCSTFPAGAFWGDFFDAFTGLAFLI